MKSLPRPPQPQVRPTTSPSGWSRAVHAIVLAIVVPTVLYVALVAAVLVHPTLETHFVYMHSITRMASVDALNSPELFGFLRNQVRPFTIPMPMAIPVANLTTESSIALTAAANTTTPTAGPTLHAWHVLPLNRYRCHSDELVAEPAGLVDDPTSTRGFALLRDDPDAVVAIHLHGASGTMASMVRPQAYRALSAADTTHVHVLTLDYRGYGLSSGMPSEGGLIADAVALAQWAMDVAHIPPERIVVHAQSLGTAVAIGMVEHFAMQDPPVEFAGLVLTAGMYDVASLTAEFRFNGVVRLMAPLDPFPSVLAWMTTKLRSTWKSGERLRRAVQRLGRHHVELLHAEDDRVVSFAHLHWLFGAAVAGTVKSEDTPSDVSAAADGANMTDLGAAGAVWEWSSARGVIRKHLLPVGEHDVLMTFPATTEAVRRAFGDALSVGGAC